MYDNIDPHHEVVDEYSSSIAIGAGETEAYAISIHA